MDLLFAYNIFIFARTSVLWCDSCNLTSGTITRSYRQTNAAPKGSCYCFYSTNVSKCFPKNALRSFSVHVSEVLCSGWFSSVLVYVKWLLSFLVKYFIVGGHSPWMETCNIVTCFRIYCCNHSTQRTIITHEHLCSLLSYISLWMISKDIFMYVKWQV